MTIRLTIFFALALLICGCTFWPETYYRPEAETGRLVSTGQCADFLEKIIRFEGDWGDVSISLDSAQYLPDLISPYYTVDAPSSYERGANYLKLRLFFDLSEGSSLVVRDQKLGFYIDSAERKEYRFNSFYQWDGRLEGTYPHEHWVEYHSDIVLDELTGYRLEEGISIGTIWLDVDAAGTVRVDQFQLEIGSKILIIGPIKFIRKTGVDLKSISC